MEIINQNNFFIKFEFTSTGFKECTPKINPKEVIRRKKDV